jgi:hypothetical protein
VYALGAHSDHFRLAAKAGEVDPNGSPAKGVGRITRIARIARAILKATASLALVSLPSPACLPLPPYTTHSVKREPLIHRSACTEFSELRVYGVLRSSL